MSTRILVGGVVAMLGTVACESGASAGTIFACGNGGAYGLVSGVPSGNDFVQASAWETHGLAVHAGGAVTGWGDNSQGQLNLPAGTYSQVATGVLTSYALTSAGTIGAWGYDAFGQVSGVPSGTFTKITAGRFHATALRSDGVAIAWGYSGGFGVGTFKDVSSGMDWSLGVRTDGTLYSWGTNSTVYGLANVPAGNNFIACAAGSFDGVALRSDGTLVAWGDPSLGMLSVPSGNDFVAVAAGHYHAMALHADGSVSAWGWDGYGQVSTLPAGTFSSLYGGNGISVLVGEPAPAPGASMFLLASGMLGIRRRR